MIKHLFKIIWAQRRSNGWIFAELLIAACALWYMTDRMYVDLRTWYTPLGYDIANTWRFKLTRLSPLSPAYVPESEYTSTQTDDLLQLMAQIRQHPAVEEVCVAYYSCPYSFGNSWWSVMPVDGDTTLASQKNFQVRRVSPEYFDVFRVKDVNGNDVSSMIEKAGSGDMLLVVTADMEEIFYHGQPAAGRKVRLRQSDVEYSIAAVSVPIRTDEYTKSEPAYYTVARGASFKELVEGFGYERAELCVRTGQTYAADEMNRLLEEMSERLTVNNLNVYGVSPVSYFRDIQLSGRSAEQRKQLSLAAFLLVNVFFGIIGTFWLRTQQRRGEAGIRMALGASRRKLKTFLYGEGLCLLFLTLPAALVFAVNMIVADIPDTYRLPYTAGRFLVTFGGVYLLMALMIVTGIRFPVRKTMKTTPAEALHYE
jgi:hypothetical protein